MKPSKSPTTIISINKWTTDQVLEWLFKKLPDIYNLYKSEFIKNQITGE